MHEIGVIKKRSKREKMVASATPSQSNSNEPTSLQAVMDAEVALGSNPFQKSWADRCGSGYPRSIMTEEFSHVPTHDPSWVNSHLPTT